MREAVTNKRLPLLAVVALVSWLMVPGNADAVPCGGGVPCACGDTVVASTTLVADLDCSGPGGTALIIGANVVTVNLDGNTISGDGTTGIGVDNTAGFNNVTIRNGTIKEFVQAVRAEGVRRLVLKDLTIEGGSSHAIEVLDSRSVTIRDSFITIGTAFGREAIRLESVRPARVIDVSIIGGFVGINFACGVCDGSELPTNGTIKRCTISDTGDNGILLANTTNALVTNNVISGAAFGGIQLGFDTTTPVTDVQVVKNVIIGTSFGGAFGAGILLIRGAFGNTIRNNVILDSAGNGITVDEAALEPFDNTIRNNISNANTGFGYSDNTTDSGTAGTENTYELNSCLGNGNGGSDPAGLCTPQP